MTPRGFTRWMDRHSLSPGQAADFLGVDRKSIDRFLSGDLPISQRTSTACRALDPLKLYRLTPIDLDHADWRASSHKAPAIVRAQGETLARWHAAKTFHVRTRQRVGERQSPENPWLNPRRVGIEAMEPGRGLAAEGQPGVVQPVAG